jgi:hypothetical protein
MILNEKKIRQLIKKIINESFALDDDGIDDLINQLKAASQNLSEFNKIISGLDFTDESHVYALSTFLNKDTMNPRGFVAKNLDYVVKLLVKMKPVALGDIGDIGDPWPFIETCMMIIIEMNPSPYVFETFLKFDDLEISNRMADSPNCPVNVLQQLAKHPDEYVSDPAKENLLTKRDGIQGNLNLESLRREIRKMLRNSK